MVFLRHEFGASHISKMGLIEDAFSVYLRHGIVFRIDRLDGEFTILGEQSHKRNGGFV